MNPTLLTTLKTVGMGLLGAAASGAAAGAATPLQNGNYNWQAILAAAAAGALVAASAYHIPSPSQTAQATTSPASTK